MKAFLGTDLEALPSFVLEPHADPFAVVRGLEEVYERIGTKEHPLQLSGGVVHRDNVFVEFAPPATTCVLDFVNSVFSLREEVEDLIHHRLRFVDYHDCSEILNAASQRQSPVLEALLTFGCSPDYKVGRHSKVQVRQVPPNVVYQTMREAGGHLHMDIPKELMAERLPDIILGLDTTYTDFMCQGNDAWSPWYRSRSVFRPKPYGLEYRTLGARWAATKSATKKVAGLGFKFMRELEA